MNLPHRYTASLFRSEHGYRSVFHNDIQKHFEIYSLEELETPEASSGTDFKKLDRYEVIWIKKGKGSFWVDETVFQLEDSIMLCLSPGHVRKWGTGVVDEGYYISFTPEFVSLTGEISGNCPWLDLFQYETNISSVKVEQEVHLEMESIAKKMKCEYNNYLNRQPELLKHFFNIFMIYFTRNLKETQPSALHSKEVEIVRNFMNLLKKKFLNQKMVSDYASQLCITPNYLNRTVKKITGFTASYHIQQQIILEAKRKAIYTSVSMKEIAYYLGFDNLAHFSKFFKTNCGMNFTDFKKNMLSGI